MSSIIRIYLPLRLDCWNPSLTFLIYCWKKQLWHRNKANKNSETTLYSNLYLYTNILGTHSEVREGSSGEDKVEDETLDKIFPKSRMRRGEGFFPFPRPYWWQDKEFLGIFAFF